MGKVFCTQACERKSWILKVALCLPFLLGEGRVKVLAREDQGKTLKSPSVPVVTCQYILVQKSQISNAPMGVAA